jgi:hypothetical protein
MDGHASFVRYPGGFPVCPSWIWVIDQLVNVV